jgi:hypothetical protein
MNTKPMDEFLNSGQEGQISKVEPDPHDGTYTKDDELPRLTDASKATAPSPLDHKVQELADENCALGEAAEDAAESDC